MALSLVNVLYVLVITKKEITDSILIVQMCLKMGLSLLPESPLCRNKIIAQINEVAHFSKGLRLSSTFSKIRTNWAAHVTCT